jgi:hypothetical protein
MLTLARGAAAAIKPLNSIYAIPFISRDTRAPVQAQAALHVRGRGTSVLDF